MGTKEAVAEAQRLGATVVLKAGEVMVSAPGMLPVRVQHWSRRKDAGRALVVMVKRLRERNLPVELL